MNPPFPLRPLPPTGLGAALIGAEEEALVLDVVRRKEPFRYYGSHWTSPPPPMAATLEREFSELTGSKFALAVTSGTAALECALGALGVGPGDEVIVPAWSWVSCYTAVVRVGGRPVLAEVDDSFCLAPGEIARLRTPATKAAIVVHYQGVAADMDVLLAEAREAGIKILEDCAESAGALYKGKRIGSLGDIGIFSFQGLKSITSGEGGLIVTDDPDLFERAIRMHDLGQVRPFFKKSLEPHGKAFCGSQFRISELQAAMALAQLRKLDGLRATCRVLSARVVAGIQGLDGIEFRSIPDPEGDSGIEIYVFLKDAETAQFYRDGLTELNVHCAKNTGTYCHYAHEYCRPDGAHTLAASPLRDFEEWPAPGYRAQDFPRTEAMIARYLALPIGVLYTEDDADYIAACVRHVHSQLNA